MQILDGKDKGRQGRVSEIFEPKRWVYVESLNSVSSSAVILGVVVIYLAGGQFLTFHERVIFVTGHSCHWSLWSFSTGHEKYALFYDLECNSCKFTIMWNLIPWKKYQDFGTSSSPMSFFPNTTIGDSDFFVFWCLGQAFWSWSVNATVFKTGHEAIILVVADLFGMFPPIVSVLARGYSFRFKSSFGPLILFKIFLSKHFEVL